MIGELPERWTFLRQQLEEGRRDSVTVEEARALLDDLDELRERLAAAEAVSPKHLFGSHQDRRRVTVLLRTLADMLDAPKRRAQVAPKFSNDPAIRAHVTRVLRERGLAP